MLGQVIQKSSRCFGQPCLLLLMNDSDTTTAATKKPSRCWSGWFPFFLLLRLSWSRGVGTYAHHTDRAGKKRAGERESEMAVAGLSNKSKIRLASHPIPERKEREKGEEERERRRKKKEEKKAPIKKSSGMIWQNRVSWLRCVFGTVMIMTSQSYLLFLYFFFFHLLPLFLLFLFLRCLMRPRIWSCTKIDASPAAAA